MTITVTDVTTGNADGDTYDANEDGVIDGPEVIEAVKDYFADKITGSEVIDGCQALLRRQVLVRPIGWGC